MWPADSTFDLKLKNKYTAEQYRNLKSKAGMVGGRVSKPNPISNRRNGTAVGLSRRKNQVFELTCICIEKIEGYIPGNYYDLTIDSGDNYPRILSPHPHQFENWYEFTGYFLKKNKYVG